MTTATDLTAPNTLTVAAHGYKDSPTAVYFRANVATKADAEALVALFPKAHNFRISSVTAPNAEGKWIADAWFIVSSNIGLNAVKGNERNETGIKRYHAIKARAAKVGLSVVWTAPAANSVATQAEFEATIA